MSFLCNYRSVSTRLVALLALCLFGHAGASAQDLSSTLEDVGRVYAESYLQPLANAMGVNLNSGLFHTARIGGGLLPLVDVYVGVKVMGALVPEQERTLSLDYTAQQTFTGSDGRQYTVPVTYSIADAPTVFGSSSPGVVTASVHEVIDPGPDNQEGTADDVVVDETDQFQLLPGLIDTPIAPFIVPQLGLGSLMGTDLVVRYLPEISYGDVGSLSFRGLGLRHSLSQYVPLLPLNVTAQVMWQRLEITAGGDDVFTATSLAGNIAASRRLLLLTVYGGLQVERAGVDIRYTFQPQADDVPSQEVAFDLTAANNFRLIAGSALNLGPLRVNVDAGIGRTLVIGAGLGLGL